MAEERQGFEYLMDLAHDAADHMLFISYELKGIGQSFRDTGNLTMADRLWGLGQELAEASKHLYSGTGKAVGDEVKKADASSKALFTAILEGVISIPAVSRPTKKSCINKKIENDV